MIVSVIGALGSPTFTRDKQLHIPHLSPRYPDPSDVKRYEEVMLAQSLEVALKRAVRLHIELAEPGKTRCERNAFRCQGNPAPTLVLP